MSEKEKRIIEIFSKAFPMMTEQEKEQLMCYGEGMFFMARQNTYAQDPGQQVRAGT